MATMININMLTHINMLVYDNDTITILNMYGICFPYAENSESFTPVIQNNSLYDC